MGFNFGMTTAATASVAPAVPGLPFLLDDDARTGRIDNEAAADDPGRGSRERTPKDNSSVDGGGLLDAADRRLSCLFGKPVHPILDLVSADDPMPKIKWFGNGFTEQRYNDMISHDHFAARMGMFVVLYAILVAALPLWLYSRLFSVDGGCGAYAALYTTGR